MVIGLIGTQDQLRLGLARQAGPDGDQPWPSTPEVWALDGDHGTADHFDDRTTCRYASRVVEELADAAQKGPHPPIESAR